MIDFKDIAWELLYGEVPEKLPDPNKPENVAYINATARAEREKLKRFMTGVGAPLVDRWKDKVRSDNLALIANPSVDECTCPSCLILREMRAVFKLLIEAEVVLKEN